MKIIHTLVDDKFIDNAIEVFEYCKRNHTMEYFLITEKVIKKYLYIKKYEYIKQITPLDFIKYINDYRIDAIIIHGMSSIGLSIINSLNSDVKIVWKAWGYDIYSFPDEISPLIKLQLYWPLTLKYRKDYCKKESFAIFRGYLLNMLYRNTTQRAIKRIDYFSGCLPIEYEVMRKNSFFKAEHLYFDYFDLNFNHMAENDRKRFSIGKDIILGNSAALAGNHLDILEILHKCDLNDSKLMIPLSYGGNEHYKQLVNTRAEQYFTDQVYVMNQFLPKDEYFRILGACGFAIYGYERQAALGNICQALYLGIKVFLSETSIAYTFFKSKGFAIYNIQKELTTVNLRKPLTRTEQETNRQLYLQTFSPSICLKHIERLIDTLEVCLKRKSDTQS